MTEKKEEEERKAETFKDSKGREIETKQFPKEEEENVEDA